MRRFILYSEIKPEKLNEYVKLHKNAWPEIYAIISESNFHNYSISIRGMHLYTYYEYVGNDYEADKRKMDESPIMKKWHTFTKPCFVRDEKGNAYQQLEEIFYSE